MIFGDFKIVVVRSVDSLCSAHASLMYVQQMGWLQ
jgi:hypothetical protein